MASSNSDPRCILNAVSLHARARISTAFSPSIRELIYHSLTRFPLLYHSGGFNGAV